MLRGAFFIDYEAGHGIGDSKQQGFESLANVLAFGLWQTGAPAFQPAATAANIPSGPLRWEVVAPHHATKSPAYRVVVPSSWLACERRTCLEI